MQRSASRQRQHGPTLESSGGLYQSRPVRDSIAVLVIGGAMVVAPGREGMAQTQKFTTPWGHPDLQGVWNNQTPVPLERPKELKDKARFTPEEVKEYEKTHANRLQGFINTVEAVNACPAGERKRTASKAWLSGWTRRRSPATSGRP
jgi:hypothetical protein